MSATTARVAFVIGGVMIAIAVYVVAASLWLGRPVTTSRVLDVAFALFFAVRGWMAIRRARRLRSP
jgi:hypothetical protein